jgi:hypothetical protein
VTARRMSVGYVKDVVMYSRIMYVGDKRVIEPKFDIGPSA